MEFVISQKGTRKLAVNGFLFTKHRDGKREKKFGVVKNALAK
jgi:hypothetical protein